ncbi:uncharacterized protein [Haliotis cracherodii]|uniref:uncharacterized protein n=1 Tax=Haliotis cracherodii TaxID=6455 RepID=UPI0039EAC6D8
MTREEFSHSSSDTQANLELSEIAHLTENGFPGCGNTPTPAPPGPRHPSVPLPCSRYRYSLSTTETRTFRSRHSRCCVGTAAILLSLLTVGVFLGIMIHFTVVDILWNDDGGVSKQPVPRAETKLGNAVPDFLGSIKVSNLEWDYPLSVSDSRPYRELAVAVEQELDRVFLLSPLKDIYNFSLVRTFRRGSIVAVFETVLTDHRGLTTDSLKEALVQGLETRNYIRGSGDVKETKHGVALDAESILIVTLSTTSLRDQSTSRLLPVLIESEPTQNMETTTTTTVSQEKTPESSPKEDPTTRTTKSSTQSSTDGENNADSHTHIWIWRPPKTSQQTTIGSPSEPLGPSTESTSDSPYEVDSSTPAQTTHQSTDWHTAFWRDQFSDKQFPFSDFWYSSSTHIPEKRRTLSNNPKRPNPDESKDGQLSENPKILLRTTPVSAVSGNSTRYPSDKTSFQGSTSATKTAENSTSQNTQTLPNVNSTQVTSEANFVSNGSTKSTTNTKLPNTTTKASISESSNSDSEQFFKPASNENDNSIPKVLSELKKDVTKNTDTSNMTNVIENIPHEDFEHHDVASSPVDETPQNIDTNVPILNEDVVPVNTSSHISEVSENISHANEHSLFDRESQQTYNPVTKVKDNHDEDPANRGHIGQVPQESIARQEHGVFPNPTHPSFEDYILPETSMENYDYVPRYPDVNLIAQNDANDEGSFRTTSPSGVERSGHDDAVHDDGRSRDEATQGGGSSGGIDAAVVVSSTDSALTGDPGNGESYSKHTDTGSDTVSDSLDGSPTVALATQVTLRTSSDLENALDESLLNEGNTRSLAEPVNKDVSSFVSDYTTLPSINNYTHPANRPAMDKYKAKVNDTEVSRKDSNGHISSQVKDPSPGTKTFESNNALEHMMPTVSKEAETVMASDMVHSGDTTVHPSQPASGMSPSEQHKDAVDVVASSSERLPVHTDLDDLLPVLQSIAQDSTFDYEALDVNPTPSVQHPSTQHKDVASFSPFVSSSATVYTSDSMVHHGDNMLDITPTSVTLTETVNGIQMLSSLLQPEISENKHQVSRHSDIEAPANMQPKAVNTLASQLGDVSVLLISSSTSFDTGASLMPFRGSVEGTPVLMANSDHMDTETMLESSLTNMLHSTVTNIHASAENVGGILHSEVEDTSTTNADETVNDPVAEPSETNVNSPAAVTDEQSGSNSSDVRSEGSWAGQENDGHSSGLEKGSSVTGLVSVSPDSFNMNASDIVHVNSPVDSRNVHETNIIPSQSHEDGTNSKTKPPLSAELDTLERKMHQPIWSSASLIDNNSSSKGDVAVSSSTNSPGIIEHAEQHLDSQNASISRPEAVAAVLQESGVLKESDFNNSTSANAKASSRVQPSTAKPTIHSTQNDMNQSLVTNSTNSESDSNVDIVMSTSRTQPKDGTHISSHNRPDVSRGRIVTPFHQEDMVTKTPRGRITQSTAMKDVSEGAVDSTPLSSTDATTRLITAGISTQDLDTEEPSPPAITDIPISTTSTDLPTTDVGVSLNKEEEFGDPYSTQSENGIGSPQNNACLDITVMTEFIPSCLDFFSQITHTDDELEKCQHFLAGVICVTDEFYKYSGQQCTDTEISAFIKQHADLFKNALSNFDPLKCVV